MTSSYAHVMDRQAAISNRLESPITANLDNLQAKKNFSVSHLLDLEEAGEMVGTQADEGVGEAGRSMLESPGLTSGSDTTQQESKCAQTESDCQPQTKLICFHHVPAEPRARPCIILTGSPQRRHYSSAAL